MTLREIAVEWPDLIPSLEARGIDYCCGGGSSLTHAAERLSLDPDELAGELSRHEPARADTDTMQDWSCATMTQLADHVEMTHHVFARAALDRLEVLVAKCVAVHAEDEPRLIELQRTIATLTEDMRDHFVREERVLFPWLRRLERRTEIQGGPPWSVRRPIDCMIHDHDDVGAAFARIHELTDDLTPPERACSTWHECYGLVSKLERDTHLHIHKENNILFPAGIEAEQRIKAVGELDT